MRRMRVCFLLALFLCASAPGKQVVFRTTQGDLVFSVYPEFAPKTVKQFLELVELGVYDSTHFFRVHPGFVAQVTDANGRKTPMTARQKAAIHKLPLELHPGARHHAGALSFAHYDGDDNSGEVSFSILLGDAPHLDGRFTVFGELKQGQDVLDRMQKLPKDGVAPLERVNVDRAVVVNSGDELKKFLDSAPARTVASVIEPSPIESWVLVWIACVAAAVGFFGSKFPPRIVTGLHLVNGLAAIFALTVALGPSTARYTWVGAALCGAWLLSFRLLSRFESP